MSFRKEKKFKVTVAEFHGMKILLLKQGMTKLFDKRVIHSIYFDTFNLNMFIDSEEGTLPRKKIRIRWYDNEKKFRFEKKISSIEGRFKTVDALLSGPSENELFRERYYDIVYGNISPSLKVSYERSYFTFGSMRITFDDKISYKSRTDGFRNTFKDPERVVEVKVPVECQDDYIEQLLPYSISRFSKYARGMLFCNGELRVQ